MEKQLDKKENSFSIGIIGSGSIGVSFAIVFARSGCLVYLYDSSEKRRLRIVDELLSKIEDLPNFNLITEDLKTIISRVTISESFEECVKDKALILECAPENLDIKKEIFNQLNQFTTSKTILASRSSAIGASHIASELACKDRCLIAHPGNPPHLIPIVEIIPADFTSDEVINRVRDIFESVGQIPVLLNKEIEGFIFNRLQGAVLREAYCF